MKARSLSRAACLSVVLPWALAGIAPADNPAVLVSSGVGDYSLSPPKAFWHTAAYCPPEPPRSPVGPGDDEQGAGAAASDPELISRIATYGGTKRKIFEKNPSRPAGECNPYHLYSDVAADASHVYWVDSTGLVRLSVEANPGDEPEVVNATITGADNLPRAELAMGGDSVFVLRYVTDTKGDIFRVLKSSGQKSTVWHLEQHCAHLSYDGQFVFYKPDPSSLYMRVDVSDPTAVGLATGDGLHGASALFSEGRRGRPPAQSHNAFVGHGPKLYREALATATVAGPIYTSTDPDASIFEITSDSSVVFFFESRPYTCPDCIFPNYSQLLFRRPRTGNGAAELIYTHDSEALSDVDIEHLTTDGEFLYWEEAGRLMRLPNDAAELPKTNVRVTGMEVTQAIQDLSNSVPLIQNKRTFVRVYAKSDGPGAVANVTCELSAAWTGGIDGPIGPHYASGSFITIYESPNRDNIDESYLFELPLSWTTKPNLKLTAVVNPNKVPIQASYANNTLTAGPFTFRESSRLEVQFIAWQYDWNGTTYSPRYDQDIQVMYSWIRRAYPLSSIAGAADDPTPGFRPRLKYIFDEDLGERVDRSADECTGVLSDDDPDNDEENQFCAANYTNSRMKAMQAELGDDVFYCGLTSDGHKFPRGRASGKVSSVPVGPPSSTSWDDDSTYCDWYAGHEIGHTLGRGHPAKAADDPDTDATEGCGHSPDDPNYPYAGAAIGGSGTTLEGFDGGYLGAEPSVLPRSTWTDVMSYCNFEWVSDYTYEGMLGFLEGGGAGAGIAGAGAGKAGDWLSVFGTLFPEGGHAALHHVRRLSSVGSLPPLRPGAFSIRLLDAGGAMLADYPFNPGEEDHAHPESHSIGFGQIVPFVPGARLLEVVSFQDGKVLAMKSISSSAPVVSNVALVSPPNPVTGLVTLGWKATDADGDSLRFDVLFSRDAGVRFEPLYLNVKAKSHVVDTSRLPGGPGRFRVVATDGVQSGFADSPAYDFAGKLPVPRILLPADGTRVHWGQMVHFLGEADDAQDGSIAAAGLQWSEGRRLLGKGPAISVDDLTVGEHRISLRAVNSLGLADSTSVDVIVDDDLSLPGPTLSVAPKQVGWHVPAGSTQVVTQKIEVSNSGAGTLEWTLSEGAEWLSVSATNGTAPAFVTLSADPAGVPSGTELKEEVVVMGPGEQVVKVAVGLAVGSIYNIDPVGYGIGFRRGDSNLSGVVDISDAVNTLNFLFGGTGVVTCPDAADANDDGGIDISDSVATLGYLFLGGAPPPAPGPDTCGGDPTADTLEVCVGEVGGC